MRTPEWIAVSYLAYLLACGLLAPLQPRRRFVLFAACSGLTAIIVLLASLPLSPVLATCRDWLPGAYLIIGYWLSGLFFVRPDPRWEARLARVDRHLFERLRLDGFARRAPRALIECLELAYLCVYALVPAGLAVLYLWSPADAGSPRDWILGAGSRAHGLASAGVQGGRASQADLFWSVVLIAAYLAYGTLPWITTRPPRALESQPAFGGRKLLMRRLNLGILDRASIQINTFPSGHAAGAVATAVVVGWYLPLAGMTFGVIAAAIATASVLGRYHYALDALLGILAALIGVVSGVAIAG